MPRVFVVAAEASADRLAAGVLAALGPGWEAAGIGGPLCRAQGLQALFPAEWLGLVGLTEVLSGVPRVAAMAASLVSELARARADVALLVDMPDFNLRVGPLLHRMGLPVCYYAAPQAWAWRPGRARAMQSWVCWLGCLFPFEVPFFRGYGVNAEFVGHPRASRARALRDAAEPCPRVVLMPGSRHAELRRHGELVAAVGERLATERPALERILPIAPTLSRDEVVQALGASSDRLVLVSGDALESLAGARAALVASGTAATECLLMGVPPVVFYRLSPLTFAIARRLVRVPHVSIANLLAGERLHPELLQGDATPAALWAELVRLLDDPQQLSVLRARLLELAAQLESPSGDPAKSVATALAAAALAR